jgi:hypothetical protein
MAEKKDIYKLNEAIEKFINEDIIPFTSGDFQKMIGVKSLKDVDGNIVPWTSYFDDLIDDSAVNEFLLFLQTAGDVSLSKTDTRQIGRFLWDAKTNPDALKGFALDKNKVDNVGHLVWSTIQTKLPHLQASFVKLGQPDDLTPLGDNLVKYFNISDTPTNVVDDISELDEFAFKDSIAYQRSKIIKESINEDLVNRRVANNVIDLYTEYDSFVLNNNLNFKEQELLLSYVNYEVMNVSGELGYLQSKRDVDLSSEELKKLDNILDKAKKDFKGKLEIELSSIKGVPDNISELLDKPTNVVDDVVVTQDRFGRDVTIPVDENGNIILYRATDDPNRIIDSDFRPLSRDKGSVGLGQQSYFSPNPMYSHKYQSSGRKNYKFATQIKPNQILPTDDIVKNYPELVNALNIPEEFTNQNWRQLVNDNKAMIAMGYETGGKRFFNDNIQTFINNGIKAFGSGSTGTGGQTYIEYEIIPLVKEGDTLGIKPIATLQTKEGFAAGKSPEAFIETPIDTPGGSLGAARLNDPLVFDSWVDNLGRTTTSFVDNLPLETVVKNRVKNLLAKKTTQAVTPGGIMDAVDVWEFAVLGLMAATVAFSEIDEVPTIITNTAINMFNAMTSFYGIPPVKKQEYDLDYEFITKVLDTGEKYMPTDIIVKKGVEEFKEGQEAGVDISVGLGAQTGVFGNSVSTTPEKTDTMETTQTIQPGVQEEKMFKKAKPQKGSGAGSGVKIL